MWYEHWFDKATGDKFDEIISRGMVKMENGRLKVNTSQLTKPYWLHVNGSTDCRNCLLWHEIFFNQFNIVHSFCRYNCWKTVTRPRNVKELIQVNNLMYVVPFTYNFINPLPGKAGLDVRQHTSKAYGVFQYATSLLEALRIKEIMHYMIRTYLPTDQIDGQHLEDTIFVKRSCTEMEGMFPGESDWWDTPQTDVEIDHERRLEEIFSHEVGINLQPHWLRDKVIDNWLRYANQIGDNSWCDFMGGQDTFNVLSREYDGSDLRIKVPEEPKCEPKGCHCKKVTKDEEDVEGVAI
jgi:hypothetical protein